MALAKDKILLRACIMCFAVHVHCSFQLYKEFFASERILESDKPNIEKYKRIFTVPDNATVIRGDIHTVHDQLREINPTNVIRLVIRFQSDPYGQGHRYR